ncbi:MAG: dockerin type I domain-containing protein [Verrucomicrobiota bacterium]
MTALASAWPRSSPAAPAGLRRLLAVFFFAAGLFGLNPLMLALPGSLGDLDEDGEATVLDLARLLAHANGIQPLATNLSFYADLNQDGFVNQADGTILANIVLGLQPLSDFPFTHVRDTSPENGESDVALTRETILRFTAPLASDLVLDKDTLYAEANGRRLLSRIEVSTDRRTMTLFYLENLPSNAAVEVTLQSSNLEDFLGRTIDGNGDGFPGGRATVTFTTLNVAAAPGTAVIGRVLASEQVRAGTNLVDHPLAGVRISVDGMEETLFTTTDAAGNFRLAPTPAGNFFVHIDGRTATESHWPQEPYYPLVGKQWTAALGVDTNLAGGNGVIYLPVIAPGTLQAVSATADTLVTFPSSVLQTNAAFAGVSINVPANSLFSDAGARGGKVGIAPVPPDRLPSPLPEGLGFPLVITVQTDGPSNFDRPVPARFPNLPLPQTGKPLPPGGKSGLWSFNHDTGEWELQGQMTVSADGQFIESDPGVGIRQPGWHGSTPAVTGKGTKIKPPKKRKPCEQNGQPCDDGDRCTTNDRCQGGVCKGDPPANSCPDNHAIPVHLLWSEQNDADEPPSTVLETFDYQGGTCYDANAKCWQFQVSSMKVEGVINLSLLGSREPNPVEGGNVTAANYCAMLQSLRNYSKVGRGPWHTFAATRAHEYYHRDVDIPELLYRHWRTAEIAMESLCLPCNISGASAAQILKENADAVWRKMQANYWEDQKAFNKNHSANKADGAYLAGQPFNDQMAQRVETYANAHQFPPCPPPNPGEILLTLVRIEATINTNIVDVNGRAQITVTGFYDDGSEVDLTSSPQTHFAVSDSLVARVEAGGKVTGLQPGTILIRVWHLAPLESEDLDLVSSVTLTVRSPRDFDGDGLADEWEAMYGLNPHDPADADRDSDGDGLTNREEFLRGTDPGQPDSDGDGVSDGDEAVEGTDPLSPELAEAELETGLHYYALLNLDTGRIEQRGKADSNGQAFHNLILSPNTHYRQFILQARTAMVGSSDFTTPDPGLGLRLPAVELHHATTDDSDKDGLSDLAEVILGSDPDSADSDGDGVPDGTQLIPDQYAIKIGDVVGNGSPAAGAGVIEYPGARDSFTFQAQPGQIVYLSLITNTVPCCVEWRLDSEAGELYFGRSLSEGNVGRFALEEGGLYTLTVGEGGTNQTGAYQFKFWEVVPQTFPIQIGAAVADGVPAAGAGVIETPGAFDVYPFSARPGQQIYLEFKGASSVTTNLPDLEYRFEDDNGYLYADCVHCSSPGVLTLVKGGNLKLIVGNGLVPTFRPTPADTGTYEFKLWDVPPAQQFNIAIGDLVTNGLPAAGAGMIETPGTQDVYTFTATPGQAVYFQKVGTFDSLSFITWTLRDEEGERIFSESFNTFEPGAYTLARGGKYTITVQDRDFFGTGPYQFRLWDVPPPQRFTVAIGDTVSDGQPGPGAGRIETPGVKDIYQFQATAGTKVDFRVPASTLTFVDWTVADESGEIVLKSCLGCGDPGVYTLTRGGTYTLTVGDDRESETGSYELQILPAP